MITEHDIRRIMKRTKLERAMETTMICCTILGGVLLLISIIQGYIRGSL